MNYGETLCKIVFAHSLFDITEWLKKSPLHAQKL